MNNSIWKQFCLSLPVALAISAGVPAWGQTFTLDSDVIDCSAPLRIGADNITLDLAGHTVKESPPRFTETAIVDELAGRLGMPVLRPRSVRHNNDVFAGRRGAFPPVGQVEEVPSHNGRPHSLPHRTHVADRVPGDLERPTVDDLGVAIEVPLEQGTNVVLRVCDEAIDRDHRVHEYSAHESMMSI